MDKLDIFIEVGETLRFSEVAKRRYTTQPTISRQIAALEEEWGIQLFNRTNKGLILTPEGAVMLSCCQKVKQQLDTGLYRAKNMNRMEHPTLRLGFLESFDMERLFYPMLERFSQLQPQTDISIVKGSLGDLRRKLEKNHLDIIYTFSFERANVQGNVICMELLRLNTMLALSEYHPLFGKDNLSIDDCKEAVFYLPEEADSPGREADLQKVLAANGIRASRLQFVSNIESALFQMRMGKGLALIDDTNYLDPTTKVRTIPLKTGQSHLALTAIWNKENLNPQIAILTNMEFPEI